MRAMSSLSLSLSRCREEREREKMRLVLIIRIVFFSRSSAGMRGTRTREMFSSARQNVVFTQRREIPSSLFSYWKPNRSSINWMQIDGKRPFAIEYETDDACRPVYIAVFLSYSNYILDYKYKHSSFSLLDFIVSVIVEKEKKIEGIEAGISLNCKNCSVFFSQSYITDRFHLYAFLNIAEKGTKSKRLPESIIIIIIAPVDVCVCKKKFNDVIIPNSSPFFLSFWISARWRRRRKNFQW